MQTNRKPSDEAFRFKGRAVTFTVVELLTDDLCLFEEQLIKTIERAPDFFKNSPVAIDFGKLTNINLAFKLPQLINILIKHQLTPIGVFNADGKIKEQAISANLSLLNQPATENTNAQSEEKELAQTHFNQSRLIHNPIRSGQQIYSSKGDLIICNQVSAGAEVISDSNILIYGALRGRALAGVKGNETANIICTRLEADLVSIAGIYLISEQLEPYWQKSVRIYLSEEVLKIDLI